MTSPTFQDLRNTAVKAKPENRIIALRDILLGSKIHRFSDDVAAEGYVGTVMVSGYVGDDFCALVVNDPKTGQLLDADFWHLGTHFDDDDSEDTFSSVIKKYTKSVFRGSPLLEFAELVEHKAMDYFKAREGAEKDLESLSHEAAAKDLEAVQNYVDTTQDVVTRLMRNIIQERKNLEYELGADVEEFAINSASLAKLGGMRVVDGPILIDLMRAMRDHGYSVFIENDLMYFVKFTKVETWPVLVAKN